MDEKTFLSEPQNMNHKDAQKARMICPKCGAEMNHHAMKIDYSIDDSFEDHSIFGGGLQEAHTCPQCGDIELRRAQ